MKRLAVHWYEGMFLKSQHFQAADRYWEDRVSCGDQWDHPYGYGVKSLDISLHGISNAILKIHTCSVRFRSGYIWTLLQPLDLEINPVEIPGGEMIFLRLPGVRSLQENVSREENVEDSRFQEVLSKTGMGADATTTLEIADETEGGNEQRIEFKLPNVGVQIGRSGVNNHDELLPLARVVKSGTDSLSLDEDFVPPAISLGVGSLQSMVEHLHDIVGKRGRELSRRLSVFRKSAFSAELQGTHGKECYLLREIYDFVATFSALIFSKEVFVEPQSARGSAVHPFEFYRDLCRSVGRLSILDPEGMKLPLVPKYDHDNLHSVFSQLCDRIEQLTRIEKLPYEIEYFKGVRNGEGRMEVKLRTDWELARDSRQRQKWFFAIEPVNCSAADCLNEDIYFKLGSPDQIQGAFDDADSDVEHTQVSTPSQLSEIRDWVLFEISSDPDVSINHWENLASAQKPNQRRLGLELATERITNIDNLFETEVIELSRDQGTRISFRFALVVLNLQ